MIQRITDRFNNLSRKKKIITIAFFVIALSTIIPVAKSISSKEPIEAAKQGAIYEAENNYMYSGFFEEGYFDNAIFTDINASEVNNRYIVRGFMIAQDRIWPEDMQMETKDQYFYFTVNLEKKDGVWKALSDNSGVRHLPYGKADEATYNEYKEFIDKPVDEQIGF